MDKIVEKLSNGHVIEYDRHKTGTCFHASTPIEVRTALDRARETRSRVRLFYGDRVYGLDWMEEHNVLGYVGRSTGNIKIPLLINNSRSLGGVAILDQCIVRLIINKQQVYRHPNYHIKFEIKETDDEFPFRVIGNDIHVANFKTREKAIKWIEFMKGERFSKA